MYYVHVVQIWYHMYIYRTMNKTLQEKLDASVKDGLMIHWFSTKYAYYFKTDLHVHSNTVRVLLHASPTVTQHIRWHALGNPRQIP